MLSSATVNLLTKKELSYELKIRGCDKEQKVEDMRKSLRQLINLQVKGNIKNIENFNIKDELLAVEIAIQDIVDKVQEVIETKEVNTVVRLEAKLEHYGRRCEDLMTFDTAKKHLTKLEQLSQIVKDLSHKMSSVSYEDEERDKVLELINLSFQDEDEFMQNLNQSIQGVNKPESPVRAEELSSSMSRMFTKITNPVEQYLKMFRATDGLEINSLLPFVRVLLTMSDETELKDSEIITLCLPYAKGPLRAKILEAISAKLDLKQLHGNLISFFVPVALREALKRDLVLRPQYEGETLSEYALEIKFNARMLKCEYTEAEVVSLIVIGLNAQTRSALVFKNMPETFNELDQLAMHCGNVTYANMCRNRSQPRLQGQFRPNMRSDGQRPNLKCFSCGKIGHLSRDCRNKRNEPFPKNLNGGDLRK